MCVYCVDDGRFVQYNPTSLERNYKHDLLTEVDLSVPIDLILPEAYSVDSSSKEIICFMHFNPCVCVCVIDIHTQLRHFMKQTKNCLKRKWQPPQLLNGDFNFIQRSHHMTCCNHSAQQHAKSVSWLRRTEYISTEYNRSHAVAEGAETKSVLLLHNKALCLTTKCLQGWIQCKEKASGHRHLQGEVFVRNMSCEKWIAG